MMFLKIRNGGSWAIYSGIDRVTFGNWNEGRVRRLRDHIKTTNESPGRWSIRKHLCVGHSESPDVYADWEPGVMYLDPSRVVVRIPASPNAPMAEIGGVAIDAVQGAGGQPGLQMSAGQGPLAPDPMATAPSASPPVVIVPPSETAVTITVMGGETDYEYPAWCFAVMADGSEKSFVFSEAYLLNENGKTIERIA